MMKNEYIRRYGVRKLKGIGLVAVCLSVFSVSAVNNANVAIVHAETTSVAPDASDLALELIADKTEGWAAKDTLKWDFSASVLGTNSSYQGLKLRYTIRDEVGKLKHQPQTFQDKKPTTDNVSNPRIFTYELGDSVSGSRFLIPGNFSAEHQLAAKGKVVLELLSADGTVLKTVEKSYDLRTPEFTAPIITFADAPEGVEDGRAIVGYYEEGSTTPRVKSRVMLRLSSDETMKRHYQEGLLPGTLKFTLRSKTGKFYQSDFTGGNIFRNGHVQEIRYLLDSIADGQEDFEAVWTVNGQPVSPVSEVYTQLYKLKKGLPIINLDDPNGGVPGNAIRMTHGLVPVSESDQTIGEYGTTYSTFAGYPNINKGEGLITADVVTGNTPRLLTTARLRGTSGFSSVQEVRLPKPERLDGTPSDFSTIYKIQALKSEQRWGYPVDLTAKMLQDLDVTLVKKTGEEVLLTSDMLALLGTQGIPNVTEVKFRTKTPILMGEGIIGGDVSYNVEWNRSTPLEANERDSFLLPGNLDGTIESRSKNEAISNTYVSEMHVGSRTVVHGNRAGFVKPTYNYNIRLDATSATEFNKKEVSSTSGGLIAVRSQPYFSSNAKNDAINLRSYIAVPTGTKVLGMSWTGSTSTASRVDLSEAFDKVDENYNGTGYDFYWRKPEADRMFSTRTPSLVIEANSAFMLSHPLEGRVAKVPVYAGIIHNKSDDVFFAPRPIHSTGEDYLDVDRDGNVSNDVRTETADTAGDVVSFADKSVVRIIVPEALYIYDKTSGAATTPAFVTKDIVAGEKITITPRVENTTTTYYPEVTVVTELPRIGDKTFDDKRNRGSDFTPTLAEVPTTTGDWTVEYSTADTNNTLGKDINDWSSTPPTDLSTVTALRWKSRTGFLPGTTMEFPYKLNTPADAKPGSIIYTTTAVAINGSTEHFLEGYNASLEIKRVYGTVKVKYVDENDVELQPELLHEPKGLVGTTYNTNTDNVRPLTITKEGVTYTLTRSKEDNRTGNIIEGETVVTYVYSKAKGSVTVEFVDREGNTIKPKVTPVDNKPVKETYDVQSEKVDTIEHDGKVYRYVSTTGEQTGEVVEGVTKVKHVYEVVKGSVTVEFVDREGNTIKPKVTPVDNKPVKETYDVQSEKVDTIEHDGKVYRYVSTTGEQTGEVVEGVTKVTHVYEEVETVEPKTPNVTETVEPKTPNVTETVEPKTPKITVTEKAKEEKPLQRRQKRTLPKTGSSTTATTLLGGMSLLLATALMKRKKEDQ